MKIVDRKTFLELPSGTIYSKYEPCFCESLAIKISSGANNDWAYVSLDTISFIETESDSDLYGILGGINPNDSICSNISMDASYRDGMFDKEQLFMVYSRDEVKNLIGLLTQTLDMSAYKEQN